MIKYISKHVYVFHDKQKRKVGIECNTDRLRLMIAFFLKRTDVHKNKNHFGKDKLDWYIHYICSFFQVLFAIKDPDFASLFIRLRNLK